MVGVPRALRSLVAPWPPPPRIFDLGRVGRPLPPGGVGGGGGLFPPLGRAAIGRTAAAPTSVAVRAVPGGGGGGAHPLGGQGQGRAHPRLPQGQGQDGCREGVGGGACGVGARVGGSGAVGCCGGGFWCCSCVGGGCSPSCCCCSPCWGGMDFGCPRWASPWARTWGMADGCRWGTCRCCWRTAGCSPCWWSPAPPCRRRPGAPRPAFACGAGGACRRATHARAAARQGASRPRDCIRLGGDACRPRPAPARVAGRPDRCASSRNRGRAPVWVGYRGDPGVHRCGREFGGGCHWRHRRRADPPARVRPVGPRAARLPLASAAVGRRRARRSGRALSPPPDRAGRRPGGAEAHAPIPACVAGSPL